MFAITGIYHRYFSHRTFKTSRPAQFIFALLGASATQRGTALVGRQSQRTSSQFRHARRSPFTGPLRFFSLPCRLVHVHRVTTRLSIIVFKTSPAFPNWFGSIVTTRPCPSTLAALLYLCGLGLEYSGAIPRCHRPATASFGVSSSAPRCCFTPPRRSIHWRIFSATSATTRATKAETTFGWR